MVLGNLKLNNPNAYAALQVVLIKKALEMTKNDTVSANMIQDPTSLGISKITCHLPKGGKRVIKCLN